MVAKFGTNSNIMGTSWDFKEHDGNCMEYCGNLMEHHWNLMGSLGEHDGNFMKHHRNIIESSVKIMETVQMFEWSRFQSMRSARQFFPFY